MAGQIPANHNSQYTGAKGKTNIMLQGQTDSEAYGSDVDMARRVPDVPKDVTV
jgi:hypothetical protein